MHPDTIRKIDRWVGVPLCFLTSLWLRVRESFGGRREPEAPQAIIFIGIAEIGALIVAHPAVRRARELYPHSRIMFVTATSGAEALALMGFEDRDLLLIRMSSISRLLQDLIRVRSQLKGIKISAAIILEPFARFSALLSVWIGSSLRAGFYRFLSEGGYLGNLLTHRLVYNPYLHASQTYVALIETIRESSTPEPLLKQTIPSQIENRLQIRMTAEEEQSMRRRLQDILSEVPLGKIVLLNPNASDIVPLRKWPSEHFAELTQALLEEADVTVVLTGSGEEWETCAALTRKIGSNRVINFAGQTTFRELIALYSISALLITNDSGPVHFSSTTGLPTLALFGPETPSIFGPMNPHAKVLYLGLACSPCISVHNQKKSTCTDNQCMKQISVSMVLEQAQQILHS
jgi:lipopolysaccharide heptosyltransferase II